MVEVFHRIIKGLVVLLNHKDFIYTEKMDLPRCFALVAVVELNAKYEIVISLLPTQYFALGLLISSKSR